MKKVEIIIAIILTPFLCLAQIDEGDPPDDFTSLIFQDDTPEQFAGEYNYDARDSRNMDVRWVRDVRGLRAPDGGRMGIWGNVRAFGQWTIGNAGLPEDSNTFILTAHDPDISFNPVDGQGGAFMAVAGIEDKSAQPFAEQRSVGYGGRFFVYYLDEGDYSVNGDDDIDHWSINGVTVAVNHFVDRTIEVVRGVLINLRTGFYNATTEELVFPGGEINRAYAIDIGVDNPEEGGGVINFVFGLSMNNLDRSRGTNVFPIFEKTVTSGTSRNYLYSRTYFGWAGTKESPTNPYYIDYNGDAYLNDGNFVGDLVVYGGTKNAVIPLDGHNYSFYTMESADVRLFDYGTAEIHVAGGSGSVAVDIDTTFSLAIDEADDYMVFLTPETSCTFFVSEKTSSEFVINVHNSSEEVAVLNYMISGKRKNFEDFRMERALYFEESESIGLPDGDGGTTETTHLRPRITIDRSFIPPPGGPQPRPGGPQPGPGGPQPGPGGPQPGPGGPQPGPGGDALNPNGPLNLSE